MSTTSAAPASARSKLEKRFRVTWPWLMLGLAAVILALAVLRVVTNADDIDSAGTIRASIRAAMPIALAGLGGLWSERSGVVNIGLEGMMIMGTLGAGYAGYQWGLWAGVVFAVVFGAVAGLIHAVATVTFGVDHIVSGVAINVIAAGAARYMAGLFFTGKPGGGPTQSPGVGELPTFDIPGLADAAKNIEDKHWFFVSDLASVLAGFTTQMSLLTVLGLALFLVSWWVLWRTTFGLRVRSCGESPAAAESLGVNVYFYKYVAVVISGGLAGLGGAFLVEDAGHYREGQTGGRGYIGLASMLFGNWRPGGLLSGAGLFGYTNALSLRSGSTSVHALLLGIGVLLLGLAVFWFIRGTRVRAGAAVGVAVLLLLAYVLNDEIPGDFTLMTPYVTTMVVLAFAAQRLRMPKADGLRYRKGSVG
jgi:simple sugar transport system permease protein